MIDESVAVTSLVILSVVAFILNSFCIFIIKSKTIFREKPSSAYIVNLLSTHIFQAVFVFPLYAGKKLQNNDFTMAQFFSNAFRLAYILAFYGGCLCVLCIAVDRFLATYLLTNYKVYVTFKNVMSIIGFTWFYVILLCLIPFIPSEQHNHNSDNSFAKLHTANSSTTFGHSILKPDKIITIRNRKENMINYEATQNMKEKIIDFHIEKLDDLLLHAKNEQTITKIEDIKFYYYVPQKEWTVFMLFFNAALPLIVITSCYMYIVYRLKELNRFHIRTKFENEPHQPKIKEFDKYKEVTKLTCILVVTYSLCWSPSIIYYTVLNVCEHACFPEDWNDSTVEQYVVFSIKYLSFLNSVFSPLIYCFHRPEIQMKLLKMKHIFIDEKEVMLRHDQTIAMKEMPFSNITVPVYQTYTNTELHQ